MTRGHFDVTDNSQDYNYSSRTTFFGEGKPLPQRDRAAHASHVAAMFLAAKEADRQYRDAAHAEVQRDGYYLKIQNQPGSNLAIEKIDSRQVGHLINVREQGEGLEKLVEATLYLKERKSDWLEKKVEEYLTKETPKQKPRNQQLIETIEQITYAELDDLWIGGENEPLPQEARQWIEVWFFNENKIQQDDDSTALLRTLIQELSIECKESTLSFPERIVMTVHANRSDMLRLMAASGDVIAFAPCPVVAGFIVDEDMHQQEDWANMITNDFTAPDESDVYLCILDSGVNHQHPLLQRVITSDDCLAAVDNWGIEDRRNHGTLMAGSSVYGDLSDYIAGRNDRNINYRLCSVKLLSPSMDGNDILWGEYVQQAVAKIEIRKFDKRLVFCSAVTASKGSSDGAATSWSAVMDKMASEDDNHRLFIISGGNVDDWQSWQNYPDSNILLPVHAPAQAWNVLTVGACTQKTESVDDDGSQRQVLAHHNGLSPFSTTSMMWKGVKGTPLKPEIVMEGGNFFHTSDPVPQFQLSPHPDLEIISTSAAIDQGNLFDSYAGTSPASALAARYAAIVSAAHPDYWPETIRGLFVQTALWTPEMMNDYPDIDDRLRVFGYGIPSLQRMLHSVEQGVTFIAQNELQPYRMGSDGPIFNGMQIYTLPWPKNTLLEMGEARVRLSVTLSYFVEPSPGHYDNYTAYNYASAGLRFDVCNYDESAEQLRNRISKQESEEDNANVVDNRTSRWGIGIKRRVRGSIHKDYIETTAAELATCNKVVVYPVAGWWKNRKKLGCYNKPLHYSLIVSLDTDMVECNLLTEIENLIQPQVEIDI